MDAKKLQEKFLKLKTLTDISKEVDVNGMKLKLVPLSSEQELELAEATKGYENLSFILQIKKETLSRSIFAIDDEVLGEEVVDGEQTWAKSLWLKDKFLNTLPQATIDGIFNAYLVLQIETEEKTKGSIKFENADAINKFLEAEITKKAVETVEKVASEQ